MVKVEQLYSIINETVKNATDGAEMTITNLTGLIDLGKRLMGDEEFKDNFFNVLADRIKLTMVNNRVLSPTDVDLGLMMTPFEYGAILQKINVEPVDAVANAAWNLKNGESVDQYIITKPTVTQKLFTGLGVWECDITIPDMQINSAFTSEEGVAAFISGIQTVTENSLTLQIERWAHMAYANLIGEVVNYTNSGGATGVHKINLLSDYNTLTGGALSVDDCMHDYEFLQYATREVNLWTQRLPYPSRMFNTEQHMRFTPPEYRNVAMLVDFTTAVSSYMRSSTYHNELVQLPNFREVPYWQGTGTRYAFEDVSAVKLTTSSGAEVTQTGVVAVITDRETIGMTCNVRKTKSAYNNRGEYTNYFHKFETNYYNDLGENALVFVVA